MTLAARIVAALRRFLPGSRICPRCKQGVMNHVHNSGYELCDHCGFLD